MANEQNLIPAAPGEVRNPKGRPKGSVNRKTVLNYLLFHAHPDELGVIKNKPAWFDTVKPKSLYELMVIAMSINAMQGDVAAFNALNKALGEYQISEETLNVVHIFKPEKAQSIDEFDELGEELRNKTRMAVEAEVIDDTLESPNGSADNSLTSS